MELQRLAPAKVNLFLHVGPLAEDGYHPICSLMAFADVGDRLVYEDAAELEFRVTGDFAQDLSPGPDNLVLRARDAALEMFGVFDRPFRLTLEKRLPIAAGLGGGSSDAAAVLLALPVLAGGVIPMSRLISIAGELGSDVPFFLLGGRAVAIGRGTELYPLPHVSRGPALVVAPGITTV